MYVYTYVAIVNWFVRATARETREYHLQMDS